MRAILSKVCGYISILAIFCVAGVSQDRLPLAIRSDAARAAITGNVDARAKVSSSLGPASGDTKLESLSLRFKMTAAQTLALHQLVAAQQNPSSPLFHKWLTPEQFGMEFGMSVGDLATVTSWLQAQGFAVTGVARGRTFVSFSGTVSQVKRAFGVTVQKVSFEGEEHLANVADPILPAPLAAVVRAVTGLSDFRFKPRSRVRSVSATSPSFTSSTSGNHFTAPADLYTIYDMNGLLNQGINGAGVKIAVLGQVAINTSDVSAFRSASGLSTSNLPSTTTYGTPPLAPTTKGTNGSPTFSDVDESQLDVEWSGAAAPNASILFVNGLDVFANAMTGAIDNDLAPILTISYGGCETQFGNADEVQLNTLFEQANAQGQTILGPAGDAGATDCDSQATVAIQGLAVDFPASSPSVTGVGGTSFLEGAGAYWNAPNGNDSGSALSYIPEQNWNESFVTSTSCGGTTNLCGLSSAGGGTSILYPKPSWQVGTGVPNDLSRDVPDVSFNADADHDGYLFCSQGSCVTGYRDTNQNLSIVGGTSVSTPVFAGMLALVEQNLKTSLGNANPVLYGLANSIYASTVFHDKLAGNNASPCTEGTVGCTTSSPDYFAANTLNYPPYAGVTGPIPYPAIGYTANTGYDLVSGLGSVDVGNLVADWNLILPAGTIQTTAASTTTLASTVSSAGAGTPLNFTATVLSGNMSATAIPTGTAQLSVGQTPIGPAVSLTNGSAIFAPYDTSSLGSGINVFTATYSGDGNYAASKGFVTVDITAATVADFTLTPATALVTVASGGTANDVGLTVSPVNGFMGPVTLTLTTSSASLAATYSFSVDPVTITATTPGTSILTLAAFGTQLQKRTGLLRKPDNARNHPATPWKLAGSGVALAGLLLYSLPRRRRRMPVLAVLTMLSAGLFASSGCGQGNFSASGNTVNAMPGTYTITVTASATNAAGTNLTHRSLVTFIVQ